MILTLQGWFYLITGLWPLLHIKSFEKVTGAKTDKWLVITVGLILSCSGIIFISYPSSEAARTLALLNAASLTAVDIWYVSRRNISKIYLLDAGVEMSFLGLLLVT